MVGLHVLGAIAVLGIALAAQPAGKQPKAPAAPAAPAAPRVPTTVVSNSLGIIIQRGTEEGGEVADEGRGWVVRDGEMKIRNALLVRPNQGIDRSLQIDRFAVTADTVVVKVNISPVDRPDAFNQALADADKSRPLTLIDGLGRKYEAVGFIWRDDAITVIRYTKGSSVKGLADAPPFGRSTPNRRLTLLFSVSLGVEIKEFRVGDAVIEKYDPALKCDKKQR